MLICFFYSILYVQICIYNFVHIDLYLKNLKSYKKTFFSYTNQCVQICIYKLIHTKSHKKTNWHIFMCVFSYNISLYVWIQTNLWLADTTKKNFEFQKKCLPIEPRYAGMCMFSTKKLRHWCMQLKASACMVLFLYQNPSGHNPRFETYTNPFPFHSQPQLGVHT